MGFVHGYFSYQRSSGHSNNNEVNEYCSIFEPGNFSYQLSVKSDRSFL
ncbi:MAG: hypothetical protein F6K39_05435 [Okeania sp. SIO3B3]|nr:hypothetical protein [Okeania sp. SIO3B3]